MTLITTSIETSVYMMGKMDQFDISLIEITKSNASLHNMTCKQQSLTE